MYNLKRWYNQNTRKIWITILTIIGVFFLGSRIMNLFNQSTQNNSNTNIQLQQNIDNLNSISLSSQKSAVTGQKTIVNKEGITIIDSFISYCNSGNIQAAYNLLSNECKEEVFQNINRFQEIYYKSIFGNGKRNVKIENWNGDIYVADFIEDAIATGRYSSENNIRDYITIVKDSENNYKLNINSYIGRRQLNKTTQTGDLQITITKKEAYMDYEKYSFEIKNSSEHEILIGKIEDDENVSYLVDKNDLKYNAVVNELTETQLTLLGGQTKNLEIKYFNPYGSTKIIEGLVFPKIYMNYEAYKAYKNKVNYTDYENVYINL